MQGHYALDREYDFKGYQGTLLKSNHYIPTLSQDIMTHPTKPHWIGVCTSRILFSDSKHYDTFEELYQEKPDYCSDFHDEEGRKLKESDTQLLSVKFEYYDLSKPYQTAPIKVWKKEVTDFKFRETVKNQGNYYFYWTADGQAVVIYIGRLRIFLDIDTLEEIWSLERHQFNNEKFLSKKYFLTEAALDNKYNWNMYLFDLSQQKQVGEKRKNDSFKNEPVFKYMTGTLFVLPNEADTLYIFCKKQNSQVYTLAQMDLKKGINQPFQHLEEDKFSIPCKEIEIDDICVNPILGIATYINSQEAVIVEIKKNKLTKIKLAVDEKKMFARDLEFSFIYQKLEDEKFYFLDLKTMAEELLEEEEGKRLQAFGKDGSSMNYNKETKIITGQLNSKAYREEKKPLRMGKSYGYELPGQTYEVVYNSRYGKKEIMTSRMMAYLPFNDKIHLFDLFTLKTMIINLDEKNKFLGFFNQVDEDDRKISYFEILPNQDLSISHIWLNEIENSVEKSIEKIERGAIIIKDFQVPGMMHRMYWEENEETQGIFIQLPYKIMYFQKEEGGEKFEKVFQDKSEPIQCVRPQFEKKKRWFYAQNQEANTLLKYVTLGDKAPKEAICLEETHLWAMSVFQSGQDGRAKGEQGLYVLDKRRKLYCCGIQYGKGVTDIVPKKREDWGQCFLSQYTHDQLQKLEGDSQFMGFHVCNQRGSQRSITVSGADFDLFWSEKSAEKGNENEEYLASADQTKYYNHAKFFSLTDNHYFEGDLQCFMPYDWDDISGLSIRRRINQNSICMPFPADNYFQVFDQKDLGTLKFFLFFKQNRIPILFTPELKLEKSFSIDEMLKDDKMYEELLASGFQLEEDQEKPKPRIIEFYSSPNRSWHLIKIYIQEEIFYWFRAHFDIENGFTQVQEIKQIKDNPEDAFPTKRIANDGAIFLVKDSKIFHIPLKRKNDSSLKEVDIKETAFKGAKAEKIDSIQITHDGKLLIVVDKQHIQLIDRQGNTLQSHNWNQFDPEENKYIHNRFEVKEAAPFSDKEGDDRIGIILQNTRDDSCAIIIWNLKQNSEVCQHTTERLVYFQRSPTQLHFWSRSQLKNALIGTPEVFQDEMQQYNPQHQNVVLSDYDRNLIVTNHTSTRSTLVIFPNKPYHNLFQQILLKRQRNYILGKRSFLMFKDPKSGESIFTQIEFNMEILLELQKAIELAHETHEEGIKDVYPMLLEASFLNPMKLSFFKKAANISKTFQNFYLKLLAESEMDFNTNSVVIPDSTEFKKMLDCPNFADYLEACKRPVEPEPIYKAAWPHKKDRLTFLRPFSYVTLQFKASELGEPSDPVLQKEIKDFESDKKLEPHFTTDSMREFIEEQNIFLEAVQFDFLHKEGGVGEFCELMAGIKDDKFLALKVSNILINVLWDISFPMIIKIVFIPYLIFFGLFIIYITNLYEPDIEKRNNYKFIFLPICMVYALYLLYFEAKQMKEKGKKYFSELSSVWNLFDVASSSLVIVFGFLDILRVDIGSKTYLIGSLAVFCLWIKLFYFMRLFKPTSSFIRMILEMFVDIKVFLLIFFCGIFAFGNAFMILDYTKTENDNVVGDSFGEAINYFYIQSIGDYEVDGYEDHPLSPMYWIYFYMSTIFIQITLLNLIIAIMGDTFERVVEVKQESQLKEICAFISEYFMYFPQDSFTKNSLILIAGLEGSDKRKSATWEGKLGAIKANFRTHISNVENKLMKMNESLHVDLDKCVKNQQEQKNSMEQLEIQIKQQGKNQDQIKESQSSIDTKLNLIIKHLDVKEDKE